MAVAAREKLAADDGAALLPGTLCCFPPPEDSDHGGWHRHFTRRLAEFTGHMTFPQIVIGDEPVGGFQDLVEADRQGRLAKLAA